MRPLHLPALAALALALFACPGKNGDGDGGPAPDGGDDENAGDTSNLRFHFTLEDVDTDRAGFSPQLRINPATGYPAVAYFTLSPDQAWCERGDEWTDAHHLRYAEYDGSAWQVETVDDEVRYPIGLDLLFDDSTPIIAYRGGEPSGIAVYCGSGDLQLARKNGADWTISVAAADSGVSAGVNIDTTGDVVGAWPALNFDNDGDLGVVFRDTHFGWDISGDYESNLEFGVGGIGSFAFTMAAGEAYDHPQKPAVGYNQLGGGGRYSRLFFDTDNRAQIVHYSDRYSEIHLTSWDGGDPPFLTEVLAHVPADERIDALRNFGGGLSVFYHHGTNLDLRMIYKNTPDAASWSSATVDASGNTGRYPAPGLLADGRYAISYYHCHDQKDDACQETMDGVHFISGSPGAWKKVTIENNPAAFEGMNSSLAVADDDTVWVVYQSSYYDTLLEQQNLSLRVAKGVEQ